MNIYSLKDVKSGYMSLMLYKNDELAIRAFKNMLQSGERNQVTMNPEDFELFSVGSFELDSGIIVSEVRFVCNHTIIGG